MNLLCGVKERAYRTVAVECVYHESNVLAHIDLGVPFLFEKSVRMIDEVCGEAFCEEPFFVRLIEYFKSVCEKAEGYEEEDSLSTLSLSCFATSMMESPDAIISSTIIASLPLRSDPRYS